MAKTIDIKKGFFQITKDIDDSISAAVEAWKEEAPPKVIEKIKELIRSGNSPIEGQTRFVGYSPRYVKRINSKSFKEKYPDKKVRPVNLELSGKMLRSLIRRKQEKGFVIFFTSPLAKYHSINGPNGASKYIRKLTPTEPNERFKRIVTQESQTILTRYLSKKLKTPFKE